MKFPSHLNCDGKIVSEIRSKSCKHIRDNITYRSTRIYLQPSLLSAKLFPWWITHYQVTPFVHQVPDSAGFHSGYDVTGSMRYEHTLTDNGQRGPVKYWSRYTVHICGMWSWPLQWRNNERDGIPNYQSHDCLLNCIFKAQIKENTKAPRHWPLCEEFTGDRWIPAQRASNAEKLSI